MLIEVKVPGSTANIGVGFDSLGLALTLYNKVMIKELVKGEKTKITYLGPGNISCNIDENLVYKAFKEVFIKASEDIKSYLIEISNEIPLMGGLGSSSAAIVCGLVGANALINEKLSKEQLLNIGAEIEGHADNVSPALYGGLTFCYKEGEAQTYKAKKLKFAKDIEFIGIKPDYSVSTDIAREALPKSYSLETLVESNQKFYRLIKAFEDEDYKDLEKVLQDKIHEPYREKLVPGLYEAKKKAYKEGAICSFISGSGPTLGIFIKDLSTKEKDILTKAVQDEFRKVELNSQSYYLRVDYEGAHFSKT